MGRIRKEELAIFSKEKKLREVSKFGRIIQDCINKSTSVKPASLTRMTKWNRGIRKSYLCTNQNEMSEHKAGLFASYEYVEAMSSARERVPNDDDSVL